MKIPGLPSETSQNLADVANGMDQVIRKELNPISRQLYPALLRIGLVPTLQSLSDQFENTLNINAVIDEKLASQEREDRNLIPERVRLAAYRIAEDALNNVVKHAKASRVTVWLEPYYERWLRLMVRDNGQGFNAEKTSAELGLAAMQDYAATAGSRCTVYSAEGLGTVVTATLPLQEPFKEPPERG